MKYVRDEKENTSNQSNEQKPNYPNNDELLSNIGQDEALLGYIEQEGISTQQIGKRTIHARGDDKAGIINTFNIDLRDIDMSDMGKL